MLTKWLGVLKKVEFRVILEIEWVVGLGDQRHEINPFDVYCLFHLKDTLVVVCFHCIKIVVVYRYLFVGDFAVCSVFLPSVG